MSSTSAFWSTLSFLAASSEVNPESVGLFWPEKSMVLPYFVKINYFNQRFNFTQIKLCVLAIENDK